MKFIVEAFNVIASGSETKIWAEGVHVCGEKYITTKAESRSIYARQVRIPCDFTTGAVGIMEQSRNTDKVVG
jgi:hypothetical protein